MSKKKERILNEQDIRERWEGEKKQMECNHDLVEREVAVTADGMCPLCMAKKIDELDTAFNITTGALEGSLGVIKELHEEVDIWVQHCVDANREVDKQKIQIKELEGKLVLHDKSEYEMVNKQFLKQLNERIDELEARVESLNADLEHQRYKGRREEE